MRYNINRVEIGEEKMANDIITNRKSKDSIFVKLFQDKNNVLKLYKEIHPENDDVSVDDINIHTLDSVIVNTIYIIMIWAFW